MKNGLWLWVQLAIPIAGSILCLFLKAPRRILWLVGGGVAGAAVCGFYNAFFVLAGHSMQTSGGGLFLDALSAYHLMVMMIVYVSSSLFAWTYFHDHIGNGSFNRKIARRFGSLWFGSMAAMTLVLISNNIGIMWVGVEATTLLTAFLICIHVSPSSLEATWKYLIVCSVGVAFAFMGTLLVGAAATQSSLPTSTILHWTELRNAALFLNPALMKLGFIFLLIGYGTKTGLAPMHSWLPDAHSQAPAPVSALFSGFLLNSALYCIMRFVPLVETATNNSGWCFQILIVFGLLSILMAAVFIVGQRDLKRLLAYSSVEHLGIITLGLGLGKIGVFAALFHTLNHALCKPLAFFSAGRIGQLYGTHEIQKLSGSVRRSRLWGWGLFIGLLALIGLAPFSLFYSEFMVLIAAVQSHRIWIGALYLAGLAVVFLAVSRFAIGILWGPPRSDIAPPTIQTSVGEWALMIVPLGLLLLLGVWIPTPLRNVLREAASVIGGAP